MTYLEFIEKFPDDESVAKYLIEKRFKGKIICPFCGKTEKDYHAHYNCRNAYCNNCKREFSIFKGTIFEETRMPLRHWLYAINMVCLSKKGISAMQLKRELGVSYKTAWRMMHKIRGAMAKREVGETFEAIVEIDETYVGGKPRKKNEHGDDDDLPKNPRGRGTAKVPVIGVRERGTGKVHAVVANRNEEGKQLTGKQLFNVLSKVCKPNTKVMTDQFKGYNILNYPNNKNLTRIMIDHNVMFSASNGVHTNGIESFWALLKRGIHGIFHHVSLKHLQKYVDEFCFRQCYRNENEAFEVLMGLCWK